MYPNFRASPSFLANPPTTKTEKTVVVLGAFRGGTSMVARILQNLGVFMGEEFAAPDREYENAEDKEFQGVLHRRDLLARTEFASADFTADEINALKTLIERRNRKHSLWGWKYPATVLWCLHADLERYLRNPHFITVFRDPLAVFQHEVDKNCIKPNRVRAKEGRSLSWIGLQYQRLIEHVVRTDSPHLLISYERAITGDQSAQGALVESLIGFLQPALANPSRENALLAFE